MPGCIVSATTASFRSVAKRRRRATPVITLTFENVSDIGGCLGLSLGPPAISRVRSKPGALHHPWSATDPQSLNAAAWILSSKVPGNPYYSLLADGPTEDTRRRILELCPEPDPTTEGSRPKSIWLWETGSDIDLNKPLRMGWDCVFVAT